MLVDLVLCLLDAPVLHRCGQEHARKRLPGCGGATEASGAWMAAADAGSRCLGQGVIVEQLIDWSLLPTLALRTLALKRSVRSHLHQLGFQPFDPFSDSCPADVLQSQMALGQVTMWCFTNCVGTTRTRHGASLRFRPPATVVRSFNILSPLPSFALLILLEVLFDRGLIDECCDAPIACAQS